MKAYGVGGRSGGQSTSAKNRIPPTDELLRGPSGSGEVPGWTICRRKSNRRMFFKFGARGLYVHYVHDHSLTRLVETSS